MGVAPTRVTNSRNFLKSPPADVSPDKDSADDNDWLVTEVKTDQLLIERGHFVGW